MINRIPPSQKVCREAGFLPYLFWLTGISETGAPLLHARIVTQDHAPPSADIIDPSLEDRWHSPRKLGANATIASAAPDLANSSR